ncbi:Nucleotide-binding universal stress protein, UspA family [Rathayibacter oskolensis]|uniref:Nucleotide-binding universal stress protein, UspA family n=1 Tax=Rathayibacter oskolensis TaxID=1891671 RepID=A0A1X7N2B1_9MICO|nr:universal stress protein [Rathayibacter oskolensis]SMH31473.1 Nucleotide-binding universal stress protein, UspA family [Rathayibacter oskolensis]
MDAVVVGVSGSDRSADALRWGLEYARGHRLPVDLVTVIEPVRARLAGADAEHRRLAGAALEEARSLAASEYPEVRTRERLLEGDPVHLLADAAPADALLVLGAQPLPRRGGVVTAPVAVRVAAASRSAVALIPGPSSGAGGRVGVAVGVDGSEVSLAAIRLAAVEADRLGEPLLALHAWQLPGAWADSVPVERIVIDAIEEDENLVLAESLVGLRDSCPDLEVRQLLVRGNPVERLTALAATSRLLVLGSHGRGAFLRLLLGSVSHSLALTVPGPLIILRHRSLTR